jgi:hypothetical protein
VSSLPPPASRCRARHTCATVAVRRWVRAPCTRTRGHSYCLRVCRAHEERLVRMNYDAMVAAVCRFITRLFAHWYM